MNQDLEQSTQSSARRPPETESARKGFLVMVLLIGAIAIGAGLFAWNKSRNAAPQEPIAQAEEATKPPIVKAPAQDPDALPEPATTPPPPAPVNPALTARQTPPATAPKIEPSTYTRNLVAGLAQIDLKSGPLTPEKIAAWKQGLAALKAQGAEAVPAILEYMAKNTDLNFDAVGASKDLGSSSLRMALLESLQSIGGQEGLNASLSVLQSTTDPKEIAYLAKSIDTQVPDQYRQEILSAVRETINMAGQGKLNGADVGPLFEALTKYGGAAAIADLESALSKFRYYSVMGLANTADNLGLKELMQMVNDPNSPFKSAANPALQVLAEHANESPEIKQMLMEKAKADAVPYSTWVSIIEALGGAQMHYGVPPGGPQAGDKTWSLLNGPQFFYSSLNPNMTEADMTQRISTLSELAPLVKSPEIQAQIQQQISRLQTKLGK
jgi:hypothetical protein